MIAKTFVWAFLYHPMEKQNKQTNKQTKKTNSSANPTYVDCYIK